MKSAFEARLTGVITGDTTDPLTAAANRGTSPATGSLITIGYTLDTDGTVVFCQTNTINS